MSWFKNPAHLNLLLNSSAVYLNVTRIKHFLLMVRYAGSLSGHVMSSSCKWYGMITSAFSFTRPSSRVTSVQSFQRWAVILHHTITSVVSSLLFVSKCLYPCRFCFLRCCLWMTLLLIQICICISRDFIATHFPHQVILCLLAGKFTVIMVYTIIVYVIIESDFLYNV